MKHRFRAFKWILLLLLCVAWFNPMGFSQVSLQPMTAHAETGVVIIAADTSVRVGDSLNVTVKYSASGLGLIDGELRYDPDMLKYVSGGTSATPTDGVIKMNKQLAGETSQLFTIRFVAIGPGSDFFLVNTFQLKDGKGNDLGKPGASVKLIVSEVPAATDPEEPVTEPEDSIDNPSTDTPDTTEDPGTDEPATDSDATDNGTDDGTNAPSDSKGIDSMWVLIGTIAATTVLLVLALVVVNRRRKAI